MSATQAETTSLELRDLDVDQIDPNPANPRLIFPQDELDKLTESIALEGVLVPILVYPKDDRFVLVDGERRFRCAMQLGHDKIKAVINGRAPGEGNAPPDVQHPPHPGAVARHADR